MTDDVKTSSGWRGKVTAVALTFAILTALWFAAAALGTKFGLWSWQFGLGTMIIGWGPKLVIAALGLSLIALIVAVIKAPRTRPVFMALGALLISGMMMGRLLAFKALGGSVPPIHDIATNWDDPLMFSAKLMALREADGASNAVEIAPVIPEGANARWPGFGGRLVSEIQEEAEFDPTVSYEEDPPYPQLDTIVIAADIAAVSVAAERVADKSGWDVVTEPVAGGNEAILEATAISGWFGFRDDVIVRMRSVEGGTSVDVRSISRVGFSDLGANAHRVDEFLKDLRHEAT